jgi:hypothetical protein
MCGGGFSCCLGNYAMLRFVDKIFVGRNARMALLLAEG